MNKLIAELQRLYFLDGRVAPEMLAPGLAGETGVALDLLGADGMARAMVVAFEKSGEWETVAGLYRGVQEDLDLPAPAISISGRDGYQVWFSLARPVPSAQIRDFLDGLRRRYLADVPPAELRFHPSGEPLFLVPALHAESGKWSAFIDPSMGAMFADEPGLEMAPNLDKQGDLLAGFESIESRDFLRALQLLQAQPEADAGEGPAAPPEAAGRERTRLNVGSDFTDPQSFLLAVMNDPSASAGLRIKAAKALLPYFADRRAGKAGKR